MGIKALSSSFKYTKKKKGVKAAIQSLICRLIGVDGQIEALQYFLNELHKPVEIKETHDKQLRNLQECDALLLVIFHKFCKKYNLNYWMDYGTLLGAVRHHGFIPWDDDMDVAMPREDYDRVEELLRKEFGNRDFSVEEHGTGRLIGFSYKHKETGIWLDIFPVDTTSAESDIDKIKEKLSNRISIYRKFYNRCAEKHDRIFFGEKSFYADDIKNEIIYHCPEFKYLKNLVHNKSCIFPLSTQTFEGYELNAPWNCDEYLRYIYGDNYMRFPKDGVMKHGLGLREPMSRWAEIHAIDMTKIKKYFQEIINNMDVNKL